MKTILNSSLSFKAIEAKARKAAAVAAAKTKQQRSIKPQKIRKRNRLPLIEREINSIFMALKNRASEGELVKIDRPGTDAACRARISVFSKPDADCQNDKKTIPSVIYAFYPSTLDPHKLGSVAIYGKDARATQNRIQRCGYLFGHPVIRATVEIGRRPFVDVLLSA